MKHFILYVFVASLGITSPVWADDDEGHEHGFWQRLREGQVFRSNIGAADNPQYKAECGSCHMAYPPGLLPARSWQKLMQSLARHFGDNAELAADIQTSLTKYLVDHASDRGQHRPESVNDNVPVRITETAFFIRKHDELPRNLRDGAGKQITLSACNSCHPRAIHGIFDEHEVTIPGKGRWED